MEGILKFIEGLLKNNNQEDTKCQSDCCVNCKKALTSSELDMDDNVYQQTCINMCKQNNQNVLKKYNEKVKVENEINIVENKINNTCDCDECHQCMNNKKLNKLNKFGNNSETR